MSASAAIVVEAYVPKDPRGPNGHNLRDHVWSYAMDQRAFGPRELFVAVADAGGTMLGMAITKRRNPIDPAFEACLIHLGDHRGDAAAVAVANLDETVADESPRLGPSSSMPLRWALTSTPTTSAPTRTPCDRPTT